MSVTQHAIAKRSETYIKNSPAVKKCATFKKAITKKL